MSLKDSRSPDSRDETSHDEVLVGKAIMGVMDALRRRARGQLSVEIRPKRSASDGTGSKVLLEIVVSETEEPEESIAEDAADVFPVDYEAELHRLVARGLVSDSVLPSAFVGKRK